MIVVDLFKKKVIKMESKIIALFLNNDETELSVVFENGIKIYNAVNIYQVVQLIN